MTVDGQTHGSSFLAGPADPEAFSIYAVSDTQVNPAAHNRVMGAILSDIQRQPEARQTILLHGGDHISHGLYEPDWDIEYFNAAYRNVTGVLGSLPVVASLSNHLLYAAEELRQGLRAAVCEGLPQVFSLRDVCQPRAFLLFL